ncbi:MAG: hypothetical protein QOF85_1918 [Solirubrobacterales bacterium]|jgi:hypothetical protein|nr:hypothetical protein [Solirubrobacterales bacterium]
MIGLDDPHSDERAEDRVPRGEKRGRRAALVGGALVLLIGIAVAVLLLTRDSGEDTPAVDPAITKQQNYHQAEYAVGVSSGWPQDENDRRIGGNYLESAWHDPASTAARFVIDSRPSDETGSPMASAELARIQAHQLPGYRQRGLKEITLWSHPAVRWAFDVAGEAWIEYFFEECGTSIVVRGSTPPVAWEPLTEFFRGMAETITANCE